MMVKEILMVREEIMMVREILTVREETMMAKEALMVQEEIMTVKESHLTSRIEDREQDLDRDTSKEVALIRIRMKEATREMMEEAALDKDRAENRTARDLCRRVRLRMQRSIEMKKNVVSARRRTKRTARILCMKKMAI